MDKYHSTTTSNMLIQNNKITEKIEEEDKHSDYSEDDKQAVQNIIMEKQPKAAKGKKNYLQKTIFDQTKELCFEHSSLYKDFDSVYQKILLRFQQWELFDDSEISLAC